MIEAELPDGTILEFPDGTDPSVIQRTVKRVLGVGDVVEDPLADERTVGGQTFEFDICRAPADRKSTRLNSSHLGISYAVFNIAI